MLSTVKKNYFNRIQSSQRLHIYEYYKWYNTRDKNINLCYKHLSFSIVKRKKINK